ncbi:serine/threonine-protein kinase MPS1-like isoform X2 [Phoenix dactylifera]|uniref:Serine/threonine-protein kinase MPS1-like isoform X2 n=1 Tax=Phoenix dactylifera TaxID=42345 RepID=A0A8B7MT95_PHODC|nr:serine/threonine-protein kinase MPS1-like isoform X2 [Phoenix dactylifera]
MERKANLPPPPRSSSQIPPIAGEANLTSSSSSSSSLSPRDFLRHVHAVFKRHRPLGMMHSNVTRASRVLVSQTEPSRSTASAPSVSGNPFSKTVSQIGAVVGGTRLPNVASDQRKDNAAEVVTTPQGDSSLTPPSIIGTITTVHDENMSPFDLPKGDSELLVDQKKSSFSVSSFHLASPHALADDHLKKDQFASAINAHITFQKGESYLNTQAATNDQDPMQQGHGNMEVSGSTAKFGGSTLLEKRIEQSHNQHFAEPTTRSSVMGSSCVTTMSVHSGPTFQCTRAPLAGQTAFPQQMSSSTTENSSCVLDNALAEGRGSVLKEADGLQNHQQGLHLGGSVKEIGPSGDANRLQSQALPANNPSSNMDLGPSQSNKVEKAPRKKKYDPDVFFKVNGKLYQKLGKIGSGGSSEVHKVISSDCTIYALKKIKLKGRDYPTACGFCQEIVYLNRLKGKNNIIQLVDYEVTDKTLLQEVVNGSTTIKDGRIKNDEYIYMVLEYGEIDLAHMLAQKWKEMNKSGWKLDENWLRFYWQQMLEAVNTIHEERIVHSDLKPANFLLVRGSLKLIDFGIAKAILSDTTNIQRDAQVGTLNYMSPEAFMCNEQDADGNTIKCGRPSDIWSLGCILYQMVYGKTPLAEYKTFWAKFKVVTDRNHEIAYAPVSNPWLIDLMRRCLAWDRNERLRIPQLLQHPFLVPPILRAPPPLHDHPSKLLMHQLEAYWDEPEVSRLRSELHEAVVKIEKRRQDRSMHVETNVS